MKLLSLLFLTVFLAKGCDGNTNQDIDSAKVVYEANTRGFYKKITVEKQTVNSTSDRSGNEKTTPVKISDADWKILVDAFKEVNLEEIKDLKAPTDKRMYDGAAIANLKITFKGKTYESQSFDNGFPPSKIKTLVNKITSLAK